MEPLNELPEDDAALAARFRELLPPLADDGFTARVMAALPPPPRQRHAPRTTAMAVIAGTVVGLAVALGGGASWNNTADAVLNLGEAGATLVTNVVTPPLILAVVLSVGALMTGFAMSRQDSSVG
jgi:hypothetical protein